MSGSPPPDTVVVEGVVDGAKADDPSKAKDRHKKHKKHSKKHHKSSKSKSAKDGEREHNGHTAGTSPRDVDADRESGEIEGAPQATDLSPSNAVEPISTPRSADRDSRRPRAEEDDRRRRSPDKRRSRSRSHTRRDVRDHHRRRRSPDDRRRRSPEDDRRRRRHSPPARHVRFADRSPARRDDRRRRRDSSDDEPLEVCYDSSTASRYGGDVTGAFQNADAILAKMQAALDGGNEEDEEARLIEERRRRREAILAKHRAADAPPSETAALTAAQDTNDAAPAPPAAEPARDSSPEAELPDTVMGDAQLWQTARPPPDSTAADTHDDDADDPDERRAAPAAPGPPDAADDMFAEADDIFAATPERPRATGAKRGLQDAYDDPEGYYNFQVGEVMDTRYEVYANLGRGVFSSVLRARDTEQQGTDDQFPEVAVKVLRANETMTKAGQLETAICRKLAGADPDGKRHCVRMLRHFDYRGHLCLVFEPLDMNLRELTKKYGRGVGLNVGAVRLYTAQLLQALYHLRNCGVVHADLKPDNILVNKQRTAVKVCDFGNAMFDGPDNEYTPYIGSRFYRAPEVILGLRYGFPLDMWAIACVVYELFTGKILFPGKSNNEMLKRFMDVKGAFPRKMLRQGRFVSQHFEGAPAFAFALLEEDPVTKRAVRRMIANPVVQKDFAKLLHGSEGPRRKLAQLVDLLEKMTVLDPDRRITPKEALKHPFIRDA